MISLVNLRQVQKLIEILQMALVLLRCFATNILSEFKTFGTQKPVVLSSVLISFFSYGILSQKFNYSKTEIRASSLFVSLLSFIELIIS